MNFSKLAVPSAEPGTGSSRRGAEVLKLLTFAYLKAGDKAAEAARCAEALVSKDKEDMEARGSRQRGMMRQIPRSYAIGF